MIDLDVVHETRYAYAEPVSLAHHIAYLRPLDDAHQRLLAFELQLLPPAPMTVRTDAAGNAQCHFSVVRPHHTLAVKATSLVRVGPRFGALEPASSPPWDALAARLRYVARAPFDPAVEYALPSPYVPRLEELRDYAAPSFPPGRPVLDGALELMGRISAQFEYHGESTEVDTPLAQAFAQRSGVCQDFAHLMAGAMRMLGLPVRYVSGYLLTRSPDGGAALVGADASHAWVQVYAPGTAGVPAGGWVDFDPTNDVVPGTGHVRVAVGRDYGDVAPLRGVIRGGGRHALTVAVRTRVAGPLVATAPGDQDPP